MSLPYDHDRVKGRPYLFRKRDWEHSPRIKVPRDMEEYLDEVAMTVANIVGRDCDKNALATFQYNMYTDRDFDNRDFEEAVQLAMDMLEIELSGRVNENRVERAIDSTAHLAVGFLRAALIDEYPELEREISDQVRREAFHAIRSLERMRETIDAFQNQDRRDIRDRSREREYDDRDDRGGRVYRDDARTRGRERDERGRESLRDRDERVLGRKAGTATNGGRIGYKDSRGYRQGPVRQYEVDVDAPLSDRTERRGREERVDDDDSQDFQTRETKFYTRKNKAGGQSLTRGSRSPSNRRRDDGDDKPAPARRRSAYADEVLLDETLKAQTEEKELTLQEVEVQQVETTSRERANAVMRNGGRIMAQKPAEPELKLVVDIDEDPTNKLPDDRKWLAPVIETETGVSEMEFMEHNSIYNDNGERPAPMAQTYSKLLNLAQALQFEGLVEEQIEDLVDTSTPGKLDQDIDMHAAIDTVLLDSIKVAVAKEEEATQAATGKIGRRIYRAGVIVSNPFPGRVSLNEMQTRLRRATSMTDLNRHLNDIVNGIKQMGAMDPVASDVAAAVSFFDKYLTDEYNRYMTCVMGLAEPGTVLMTSWLGGFNELAAEIGKNFSDRQVSNIAAFTTNLFRAFIEMVNTDLQADRNVHELLGVEKETIGIVAFPRAYHFTVLPFTGKEMGYGKFTTCRVPPKKAPLIRSLILSRDKLEELTAVTQATQVFITRDRQAFEIHRDPLVPDDYIIVPIV